MRRWEGAALALMIVGGLLPGCSTGGSTVPLCSRTEESVFVIEAQAVPSATRLPCLNEIPLGWAIGGFSIKDGAFTVWLNSDRAGIHAAEIGLVPNCDTSSAVTVPPAPGEFPATTFERPTSLPPRFQSARFVVFEGGCVIETFRFAAGAPAALSLEVEQAVSLIDRARIVDRVRTSLGLKVCGAGAPPCAG